jgi:hypothetical protein
MDFALKQKPKNKYEYTQPEKANIPNASPYSSNFNV